MSTPVQTYSPISIDNLPLLSADDIEMLTVRENANRLALLDKQLVMQADAMRARNAQAAKLAEVQAQLNGMLQYYGDKPSDKIDWNKAGNESTFYKNKESPLNDAILDAGLTDLGWGTSTGGYNNYQSFKTGAQMYHASLTRGDIEKALQLVKNQIDSLTNSNQMDQIRMQSLTGRRNELFDTLTNTIKKYQDSRNAIIGNLR